MLHLRKDRGSSSLLQDATRAGGRIAEETLGAAQTARAELGGLGREVRDQAAGSVSKARRRTARRLESAAAAVDDERRTGRRRKPLLLAALAGLAGWVVVKVIRSGRPQVDELADEAEQKATAATAKAATEVGDAARKVAEESDEVAKAQREHARSGNNAKR